MASSNDGNDYKWRRLGERPPQENEPILYCYFMEYTTYGGYRASKANSLIFNLKKSINCKDNEKKYKQKAVNEFFSNLDKAICEVLEKLKQQYGIINISYIPTSKKEDHKEYCNSLHEVYEKLKSKHINQDRLSFHLPISIVESKDKTHKSDVSRDDKFIQELIENYSWTPFGEEPSVLIVFDDVITTGAHFKAYTEFLIQEMKKNPKKIIALAWARSH